MDLVSIILPTYNRAKLTKRAIDSVISQTYGHWELLVIDDGSVDETRVVVEGYGDKRIRYIYKKNSGAGDSRNVGIKNASGQWITFLDSDDEYEPTKIERQLAYVKEQNADFSVCGSVYLKDNKVFKKKIPRLKENLTLALLEKERHTGVSTPIYFVKKELLIDNNILFDVRLPAYQDWDFLYQLSKIVNYIVVPEHLYRVHFQRTNRVHSGRNVLLAHRILIDKYKDDFKRTRAGFKTWMKTILLMSIKFDSVRYEEVKSSYNDLSISSWMNVLVNGVYQNARFKLYTLVRKIKG